MLLKHDDIDAGAGKQKAEHHAGRAASGDGTGCGDFLRRHAYPLASSMALR
jgi:hypothetical protein